MSSLFDTTMQPVLHYMGEPFYNTEKLYQNNGKVYTKLSGKLDGKPKTIYMPLPDFDDDGIVMTGDEMPFKRATR